MKEHKGFFVVLIFFFALFLSATEGHSSTITASAGAGGTISPSGAVPVTDGDDQTFTITPDPDFGVSDVLVDSVSVGRALSYTFTNVTADHSITASFFDCDLFPVMLDWDESLYGTIMEAYDFATFDLGLNDFTLMLRDGIFFEFLEDLIFDADASVILDGGYDCSFLDNSLLTRISGSLTIAAGTVIPSNILLSAPLPCDGSDPNNLPGNPEICDGLDNNCNGLVDDGLGTDADGDGHYTTDSCILTFTPNDDCDDNDPNNFPGNPEICDGFDNNCNTQIDEGLPLIDADGDGFTSLDSCGGSDDDCDDNDAGINPGAIDIYGDGIDQDCDGFDISAPEQVCFGCHNVGWTDFVHARVAAPETICIPCHSEREDSVRTGHYWETIRTPGNNMAAGEIIRCVSCHDWHDEEESGYDILGDYIVWAKVHAVGRLNTTCYTCHETLDIGHETGNAHDNRVIDSTCGQCHTSDTSVLGSPGTGTLTSDEDVYALHRSDCTLCHAYTGTKIDLAIVEQVILAGLYGTPVTCTDCHVDFTEIHQNLDHSPLVRVGTTSCGNCHSDPPPLTDPADPKVHNACTSCHEADFSLRSLAIGKSFAVGGDCTTCHTDPFGTLHPATIDHSDDVTTTGTQCGSCHSDPPPLIDAADPKVHNSCSSCHDAEGALIGLPPHIPIWPGTGNCVTCHGDHFPDHTHHSTAGNDVSYNPAVDTSQSSQQGCALCHHDYDTVNGTSLGLSSWETILVEHDLDGTKDGSTNTCDNCHAYDGSMSAPQAAVQSAIASGNPVTCATCHTDKVPDVDHGVPTSGKHPEHLALTGVSCATCHGNIPYFHSGTDDNPQDDLINLAETDVCDLCHQDATGNPAAGFKDGWYDPGYELGCSSCHAVTPATGSHNSHLALTNCGSCHNGTVEATTVPVQHLDQNIDVYDITPADLGYPADKPIASAYGSCSSSYCHSSIQGMTDPTDPPTYVASPVWGTPFSSTVANCTGCHNSGGHVGDAGTPLTTGSHPKHLDFRFDQDATCNACHFDWSYTGCVTCHIRDVNHVDNSIDVMFKPNFPLSAATSSGAYTGDPAPRTPYGTCSALYCHSPGTKASAPYDNPNQTNISWGGGTMPADCTGCHDGDSAAAQSMATGSHGTHITNYDCAKCHARTVDNSRSLNSTINIPKNYTYGQRYHVDGWVTVAFSSDIATSGTYAGTASPTTYRAPGSAAGSCDNTYCHSTAQGVTDPTDPPTYVASPEWGTPYASATSKCNSCHDAGAHIHLGIGTPISTGGHGKHIPYKFDQAGVCQACHFDENYTGCGNCHTRQFNHVDNRIDVVFNPTFPLGVANSSGSYSGDPAPRTDYGNCNNLYCHSPGTSASAPYDAPNVTTFAWGGTGLPTDCTGCHDGDSATAGMMTTGSHLKHIESYDCSKCHSYTVADSRTLRPDRITPIESRTFGQYYHIDGRITIAFSGDIATSGTYAGALSPLFNRQAGSGYSSCSNLYCHSDGSSVATAVISDNSTPDWGTGALSCDGCHSYPPAYDSGTPKANSHAAHDSFTCDTCHYSTTTTGDTITGAANHANQAYDVQAGSGVSFGYTFDSSGGTCSSISCHGGSGAVWGD